MGVPCDWMQCEHLSRFKYLCCVLGESGTDNADCRREVASEREVGGTIRSLINARGLELVCKVSA